MSPSSPPPVRHLMRDCRELVIDRRAGPRLRALVRRHRIEAIYERAGLLHLAGLETAALLGLPHVLEVNTPVEERRDHHGFPLYREGCRRQRRQLQLADQVACVSSSLKGYLIERGAAAARVHVIPNAVCAERFAVPPAERRAMRETLGIGEHDLALGFVGRFGFWHGMIELVEALARVLGSAPNTRAVLIGDGQLMPAVRRTLARSGVAERVHLAGSVAWELVPAYLAALDIGIMASANWYASPLKLFEYGAAGLCVVAPRVDPVTEVMEEGIDGVLVPPGDVETLASELGALIRDGERRRRLALAFQGRVRAHHVWSSVALRIGDLLAASPRRGARAAVATAGE